MKLIQRMAYGYKNFEFKRSANEILPQAKDPKGETVCACKRESKLQTESARRMRGESMKGKSKKSTYSTTFGVDPRVLACNNNADRAAI